MRTRSRRFRTRLTRARRTPQPEAQAPRTRGRRLPRSERGFSWDSSLRFLDYRRPYLRAASGVRPPTWLERPRALSTRQFEHERRTACGLRRDSDLAAHSPRELAADVEAEAGAARALGQLRIDAVELVEDSLLLCRRDPHALVGNGKLHAVPVPRDGDRDLAAERRVLGRVVDQVHDDLLDPVGVAGRVDRACRRVQLE